MNVIFATKNSGKVNQLAEIVKICNIDISIKTEADVGFAEKVNENGTTFEENSRIKAKALQSYCDKNNIEYDFVMADDSGLCVEALNGKPGVHSDRWAGEYKSKGEILDFLLKELSNYKTPEERRASFISVITAIFKDGKEIQTRGECQGYIAYHYDFVEKLTYNPVFIPFGFDKPIGEMDEEEFAKVHNHREIAIRKLMDQIKEEEKDGLFE